MNIKFFKKLGIILTGFILGIYLLFLILPFIVSPIISKYLPMVNTEIRKATGLESKIENFRIITTPKFTVGANLGKFSVLTPDNKEIFEAEKFSIRMSLLPLLAKKIEIDLVQVDNIDLKLGINKNGSFEIEKYLPVQEKKPNTETKEAVSAPMELPFGIRLSNQLPNIKIGEYNIEFIDTTSGKKYEIEGDKAEITDFILNKSIDFRGGLWNF